MTGRPLKYRMAEALVVVDDAEGEANHKLSLAWAADNDGNQPGNNRRNLLSIILSNHNWLENIALLLLLSCGLIYIAKFILIKYKLYTKKRRAISTSVESGQQQIDRENQTETTNSSLPPLAVKQLHQQLQLIGSTNIDNKEKQNSLRNSIDQSQHYVQQQAFNFENQSLKSNLKQTDMDDHLYSEIGERDKTNTTAYSDYKVPNKIDRMDI